MAAVEHYSTERVEGVDFDTPAKKGWDFFTKFLLWNIIVTAALLLGLVVIFKS